MKHNLVRGNRYYNEDTDYRLYRKQTYKNINQLKYRYINSIMTKTTLITTYFIYNYINNIFKND